MQDPNLGNDFFDKFKNAFRPVVILLLGSSSVEQQRSKIQNRAIARNTRREVRRKELRTQIQSVEQDTSLTPSKKDTKKETVAVEHTLSSLDDNQSATNVLQDLDVTNALSSGTVGAAIKVEQERYVSHVPTVIIPAKGRTFTLYVKNEKGEVRSINNPLKSLALPVEDMSSNSQGGGSASSDSFASISSAILRNSDGKEVSITTLDLNTKETQTISNNRTETESEGFFQGVDPNSNSNSIKFETQPAMTTYAVTVLLLTIQLVIMYTFLVPLIEYLQSLVKTKILNKFFKTDSKDSNKDKLDDQNDKL